MNINGWQNKVPEKRNAALVMNVILHDFLIRGEGVVSDFLKTIKDSFSDSRLFVAEFNAPSFEEIKSSEEMFRKLNIAAYLLFHPFANQGLPQPKETWKNIIQNGGWRIEEIKTTESGILVFICS